VPALRAALDNWVIDGHVLDSKLEVLMKRLIKRYHLPPIQFHAVILGYEVDFWVIDTPIVLECDSWEFHDKRRDRYERDRERDAELTAAGYSTVRFTYSKLTRQPQWVATQIRLAIDRWTSRTS
jgi:very-short-patch-repair endonuclease